MTVTRRSFKIGPHTRRKIQKAATRQRILKAAKQLFADHGYEATTMQKIAQATHLSAGNVFVHFPSKADVLATLMHDDIDSLDQLLAKGVPPRGTVRTRILKMFAIFVDFAVPTERLLRTLMAYSWSWDEHWEERFEGSIAIRRHQVRKILEDGVLAGELRNDADLEAIGLCVFSIVETIFKAARFYGYDRRRFLNQADRALRTVIEGALAAPSRAQREPHGIPGAKAWSVRCSK
ncbi:MAG: TetR/AcrR family transcriptional regulator [Burkholderiales bacterium]